MPRKIKAIKLTCDPIKAQTLYGALIGRVAYLERHGEINGIEISGWRDELEAAKQMRNELWAFLTHTRSN